MQDREVTTLISTLLALVGTTDVGVYGQYCFGDCDCSDAANCEYE